MCSECAYANNKNSEADSNDGAASAIVSALENMYLGTASDTRRPFGGSCPGAVLGPSAETGVVELSECVYQSKKPSPLARALVKTRFHEFKGEIIEFCVKGPHGLKLEQSPHSPHGCVLMRVVGPGAVSAHGSAAPCHNDGIIAG